MRVSDRENVMMLVDLLSKSMDKEVIDSGEFNVWFQDYISKVDSDNYYTNKSLQELNKEVLMECVKYNNNSKPLKLKPREGWTENTKMNNDGFKNYQDDYNKLLNPVKPKKIDFSDKDKLDEPINNMDRVVSQTLADRERELESITKEYSDKNANSWLSGEDTRTEPKKLEILDNKKERRVHFSIEEKQPKQPTQSKYKVQNILTKLKNKNDNKEILGFLKRIEEKQDKILEMLNEKK
tara:strand:- start:1615 stop:2328 length:714 start_codon:yes stop_codon:yes gene_type:complete